MTSTNEIYKAAMEIKSAIETKTLDGKDGTEKQLAYVEILKTKAVKKIDHVVSEYFTDEEYDDDDTIADLLHEFGTGRHTLESWIENFKKGWVQCTIEMLKVF